MLLHHRLVDRTAIRGLRIVKYRGSSHSANEYPITLGPGGVSLPEVAGQRLDYPVSEERISSGLDRLDVMLGGGYYRGSGVLVSGPPGTAKTTLAGLIARSVTARGERALFVSFDEPADQIVRNLKSVNIDLSGAVKAGLLRIEGFRAGAVSAEEHFFSIRTVMETDRPSLLILDPVSALTKAGGLVYGVGVAQRLLDFAKSNGVTAFFTTLIEGALGDEETTLAQISTLADTWMQVSFKVRGGERNRALSIMKSRGMKHSNQVRELVLSSDGVTLADVFIAGGEVLMGTARLEREAIVAEEEASNRAHHARRVAELRQAEARSVAKQEEATAELAALRAEIEASGADEAARLSARKELVSDIRRSRKADTAEGG